MGKKLYYAVFQTGMGWMGVLASDEGLRTVTLPMSSAEHAVATLGNLEGAKESFGRLDDVVKRLMAYFDGAKTDFHDALDLSGATPFRRAVWEQTRLILYGETRSYQWVAEKIGKPGGARAVGQALGANPLLIIVPCHRVVASGGGLGGFGGGLDMKRRLLEMEGVKSRFFRRGIVAQSG